MPDSAWSTAQLAALAKEAERTLLSTPPTRAERWTEQAPPMIEGYEILRLLGSGGMGSVWLARQENEELAIKVLHVGWTDDPEAVSRFESEADALAGLDHPHIVKLLDAGETYDGRLFLATEHVSGCDLRQWLRGGLLPPDRAIAIFRKVAAAIAHAHAHGIIHRDLKPANILIGADDLVKVTDFGLAKASTDSVTRETDTFGTPYYLAPELTRSASLATPASDVYSLAVLLYELLSGKLPLGAYTPLSSMGLDRGFDAVMKRALSADVDTRTATVEAFLREVDAVWERSSKRSRWKSRAPWLAAAALLLVGPAAGYWWSESRRAPQRKQFPPITRATKEKPWINSLGMRFIAIEGSDVLFSTHETRNAEWLPFRRVEQSMIPSWRKPEAGAPPPTRPVVGLQGWETSSSDLGGNPDHPAMGVSWQDAQFFCNWLTLRERNEGRISDSQYYRLPTDREWDIALGDSNGSEVLANFAGPEARTDKWPASFPTCDRTDAFPEAAPVGSFPPTASGLFDLRGNVLEWVDDGISGLRDDEDGAAKPPKILRGGSWATGGAMDLDPAHRFKARPNRRRADYGFRCVLVWMEEKNRHPVKPPASNRESDCSPCYSR